MRHGMTERVPRNSSLVKLAVIWTAAASMLYQVHAQPQLAAGPSFAVTSIKLNRTGINALQSMTPASVSFISASLKECLMAAYDIRSYQVAGPASLSSDRYDIIGKAEGPASKA